MKKKFVQRKLISIRLVVGQCAVVSSAENMQRMQDGLRFAAACAEIILSAKKATKRRNEER